MDFGKLDKSVDVLLNNKCEIYGSYIYKRMLLGIMPEDLDVVGFAKKGICEQLQNIGIIGFKFSFFNPLPFQNFIACVRSPCFINIFKLKKDGNNIEFAPISENVTQEMVDYAIDNLSQRKYCAWEDMRQKDKDFFAHFEELSRVDCEAHGFRYENTQFLYNPQYVEHIHTFHRK